MLEEDLEVTLSSITLASTTWRVGSLLFEREMHGDYAGIYNDMFNESSYLDYRNKKKEPKRFSLSK
jgi:hypothetical protein